MAELVEHLHQDWVRLIIVVVLFQSLYLESELNQETYIEADIYGVLVPVILERDFRRIQAPWLRRIRDL